MALLAILLLLGGSIAVVHDTHRVARGSGRFAGPTLCHTQQLVTREERPALEGQGAPDTVTVRYMTPKGYGAGETQSTFDLHQLAGRTNAAELMRGGNFVSATYCWRGTTADR